MYMRLLARGGGAAVLLVVLAACETDPIDRPGTWRPTGANQANLEAMVANPGDLTMGVAAPMERGDAGATAVTRLLIGRRQPLPSSNLSRVGGAPQDAPAQPVPGLGQALGIAGGGR